MSYATIADAAVALRNGEITSIDLTRAAIAAADSLDGRLGTYLARFDDTALAVAERADAQLRAGTDRGPLHGIPLAVKDIIATDEGPTTAQSLILDPAWGRRGDASVVQRLRAAGAVITGKTTTMEFAIGIPDESKPFPLPRNPWDLDTWAGGSSSGTANGTAAGLFFGGLGTDTGGSIRLPSAFCGTTGLKPTYGRVPKDGCVPLGYTFDTIGPIARSARDCAAMLSAIAGSHADDPCTTDDPVPAYSDHLSGSLAGLRIGVDRLEGVAADTDPAFPRRFEEALGELVAAGAVIEDVSVPYYAELTSVALLATAAEAFAYHRDDLRERWFEYGSGARMAIAAGAFLQAPDYVQLQRVRRVGQRAVARLFRRVDLIVTPTATVPAIPFEPPSYERLIDAIHTPAWNAIGGPVLALPIGANAAGLPLSMQICGRPFEEGTVLRAGDAYQRRTDWHRAVPPVHAGCAPDRSTTSQGAPRWPTT